jgi:hypothetical protein
VTHFLNDLVVDQAANFISANVTKLTVCDGAPTTFSDANTNNGSGTGRKMAEVTVDSGDFTLANDATDGRRLTIGAQNGLAVVAAGDATHVAWLDVANSRLVKVAPLATALNGLTTSSTINVPAHYHVFRDAQAVA